MEKEREPITPPIRPTPIKPTPVPEPSPAPRPSETPEKILEEPTRPWPRK